MTKNVLVSGGAGFIGLALCRRLAERSDVRVFLIDSFVRGDRDSAVEELASQTNVELIECDLASAEATSQLPAERMDVVYHLAALNGTQNFYERPYEVMRCSTLPTFTLIERYVLTKQVRRFVYAGTSESYASTVSRFGWQVPTSEEVPLCIETPLNERWSYAASKVHGEVLVAQACRAAETEFTTIRYHNVYGPRMGDKHVIPDFIERMRQGIYELYGHEETRSFMYIDDAVSATIALADAEAAANQIVNVGSPEEITMLELAQKMMQLAGVDAPIVKHDAPAGCVKRRAPDVSKLVNLTRFSFHSTVRLEQGLQETLAYYMKQHG